MCHSWGAGVLWADCLRPPPDTLTLWPDFWPPMLAIVLEPCSALASVPPLESVASWIVTIFSWILQVIPFLFLNYNRLNFLWLSDGISLSQSFYQAVVLTLRSLLMWDLLCHREQSLWLIQRITGKDFFLTLSGTFWKVGTSCRIVRLNEYNVLTDRLFWWELESSKEFVVNLIGSGIEIGLLWWWVKRLSFGY